MGVLAIDKTGSGLDGFADFYKRRMSPSELPKAVPGTWERRPTQHNSAPAPYSTSDKTSFAWKTVTERWPVLLTKTIADVDETVKADSSVALRVDGERIIRDLKTLKEDMEQDRPLRPIPDDKQPNLACYNEELRRMGHVTWRNVSWLYSECYLYRLIRSMFASTMHMKHYDPFLRQKDQAFKSSKTGVLELAERFQEFAGTSAKHTQFLPPDDSEDKLLFEEMAHICLWGNASDLSFSLQGDANTLQEKHHRTNANKNILVNDLSKAWDVVSKLQNTRIDIILDNAGFELYADLIFTLYLLETGVAEIVVLHPKSIPWFVSDVTPPDIGHLFSALSDPGYFGAEARNPAMDFLIERLTGYYADGRIIIRPHDFWTTQHSYWRLPSHAPDLLADLEESDLLIFKGDLNYRNGIRLTGDVMWPATTTFKEAIGPMGVQDVRILALRTCKADVAVGMDQEDVDRLSSEMPEWRINGKCAMISFVDNKA